MIENIFAAISAADGSDKSKKAEDVITFFMVLANLNTIKEKNNTGKSLNELEVSVRDNLGIDIIGVSDLASGLAKGGSVNEDYISILAALIHSKEYNKETYDSILKALSNLTATIAEAVKKSEPDTKIMRENAGSNYSKIIQMLDGATDIQRIVTAPSSLGSPSISVGGGNGDDDMTPIDISGVEAGSTIEG